MAKRRLAVVGIGTAGIQSMCHFLSWLDESWEVIAVHEPAKKIFGIGESSNPSFLSSIQTGADFDCLFDLNKINGTLS